MRTATPPIARPAPRTATPSPSSIRAASVPATVRGAVVRALDARGRSAVSLMPELDASGEVALPGARAVTARKQAASTQTAHGFMASSHTTPTPRCDGDAHRAAGVRPFRRPPQKVSSSRSAMRVHRAEAPRRRASRDLQILEADGIPAEGLPHEREPPSEIRRCDGSGAS